MQLITNIFNKYRILLNNKYLIYYSQGLKIVVEKTGVFRRCLQSRFAQIKKANRDGWPLPSRKCAWDSNGTNSP